MIKTLPFLGSLLPIIFPNQEFKPKHQLVMMFLVSGMKS